MKNTATTERQERSKKPARFDHDTVKGAVTINDALNGLVDSFVGLVKANHYTGYWDQRRGKMRRGYDASAIEERCWMYSNTWMAAFVDTERQSRKNCELRGKYRGQIERYWQKISDVLHGH